jgi:PAS domain-containing protein
MNADVWVTTDAAGFIIDCSPTAVRMLGYSARGARGRELPNLFIRERPTLAELLRAARGEALEREGMFRPNERKAFAVRFRVSRDATPSDAVVLLWTFDVRWSVHLRMPQGVDRRQLITVWRSNTLRCIFVPGGRDKRRLFVCTGNDEVIHEEAPTDSVAAFARAIELQQLAGRGLLGKTHPNN